MRLNSNTAISTPRVLLVPYEPHHVLKYHGWMQDPDIQEATASEPLSLEEEYSNQISWRAASDKLTFIVCLPLSTDAAALPTLIRGDTLYDSADHIVGDVNFFLHDYDPDEYDYGDDQDDADGDEYDSSDEERDGWLVGEVDIMIAERASRGRGMGKAAVCALLVYIHRHVRGLLAEGDARLLLRRGSTASRTSSISSANAAATTDADWLDVNLAGRGQEPQGPHRAHQGGQRRQPRPVPEARVPAAGRGQLLWRDQDGPRSRRPPGAGVVGFGSGGVPRGAV
uniref:N-acetyltransferase domain-containing protein n=1 Tax=Bionectria ochroleuca TaxID=29856 RepID=A0A8H7NLA8_BIOOC